MRATKLLIGLIITLAVLFIGFRIFQEEVFADITRPLILPLVTILYCIKTNRKRGHFFYFLFLYSIGELLGLAYYYIPISTLADNLMYFGCNLLYISAYIFLILYILNLFNLKKAFKQFKFPIIILLALDIYCIVLVTNIAFESDNLNGIYDYLLEFLYNSVIMILLTIALVNYLNKDSKKAMNLLIGAICIVFSEVIQVAYFYVSEIYILNVAYCLLLVIAFALFYMQNGLHHRVPKVYSTIDNPVEA